jgi:hypothetical protein
MQAGPPPETLKQCERDWDSKLPKKVESEEVVNPEMFECKVGYPKCLPIMSLSKLNLESKSSYRIF